MQLTVAFIIGYLFSACRVATSDFSLMCIKEIFTFKLGVFNKTTFWNYTVFRSYRKVNWPFSGMVLESKNVYFSLGNVVYSSSKANQNRSRVSDTELYHVQQLLITNQIIISLNYSKIKTICFLFVIVKR